jgi:hypothetical protein
MDGRRISTLIASNRNRQVHGSFVCSVAFYGDVLGAKVLPEGEPTFLRVGNIWLRINRGGGPTEIAR